MKVTLHYKQPDKEPRVIEDVARVDDSGEDLKIHHVVGGLMVITVASNITSFKVDGEEDPRAERHMRAVIDVPGEG